MLRIEDLRAKQEAGIQLTDEALATLAEADERDAARAEVNEQERQAAIKAHADALDGYAIQEAAHRKVMAKVIASTDALNEAYERAAASARVMRSHGEPAQAPMRITADQAYPSRVLVRDFHTAARSPV